MTDFVHLSVHTEFSLRDSTIRMKDLVKGCQNDSAGAVGISDAGNMFGAIRFYKAARGAKIKPIIATEIEVTDGHTAGVVSLICRTNAGYKNLMRLLSMGYSDFMTPKAATPTIHVNALASFSEGVTCLSGGRRGIAGRHLLRGDLAAARDHLELLKKTFGGHAYIEVQRVGHVDDNKYVSAAVSMAAETDTPVVATNGVRYIRRDGYRAHELRRAISAGVTLEKMIRTSTEDDGVTANQYLKTAEEMKALFADIPSAIENTVRIAKQCNYEIELGKSFLPAYPVPEGYSEASFLEASSRKGLNARLSAGGKSAEKQTDRDYDARLKFELSVIEGMGFPGYFLIVADFIGWAKKQNIPVGPGRGSGAGSLVAYALGITDLDPLDYDLLFERFLNPERVSMPDFDIDFCMNRRDEVIEYVSDRYGKKSVSQIVTFNTMAAKMVVRDVARALGHPYGAGDRIARLIPSKPGTKLQEAMEESLELDALYNSDSEAREILDYSLSLEGLARQTGKHAGGVLIAPSSLDEFTPTYSHDDGSGFVSQYDKDDVEAAGLVKFDFLGLKTLTVIQRAVDIVNRNTPHGKEPLDITQLPLDDTATFNLLKSAHTTAVFQLESEGMKGLVRRLQPDNIEEIIALVALYRPGPLEAGMVDDFVNRKHGRAEVAYPHPDLEPVLCNTYGVFVYQEQVMQAAQIMAGYSLGEADMLRRAMGKKKPEEMAKQRSMFTGGCETRGIPRSKAESIFDLMETFAGYGFNKSHSAAYGVIAYQTAWLKTHYPAEFMAAVLSADMDHTEKVVTLIAECRRMGLEVVQPDINLSERLFEVSDSGQVIYGVGAVKGLGDSAIGPLLAGRKEGGDYASLPDVCARIRPKKSTLEAMICAGMFDQINKNRSMLSTNIEACLRATKTSGQSAAESGIQDMFGGVSADDVIQLHETDFWTESERLRKEKGVLGLYLTGHPYLSIKSEMGKMTPASIDSLVRGVLEQEDPSEDCYATIGGVISEINLRKSRGGTNAFLTIDDGSSQIDVAVFDRMYREIGHKLQVDTVIFIEGKAKLDARYDRIRVLANSVRTLREMREGHLARIVLLIDKQADAATILSLAEILSSADQGGTSVALEGAEHIEAAAPAGVASALREILALRFLPESECLEKIEALLGVDIKSFDYVASSKEGLAKREESEEQAEERRDEGRSTRVARHARIARLIDEAAMVMS